MAEGDPAPQHLLFGNSQEDKTGIVLSTSKSSWGYTDDEQLAQEVLQMQKSAAVCFRLSEVVPREFLDG